MSVPDSAATSSEPVIEAGTEPIAEPVTQPAARPAPPAIQAVVFDIGETLLDRSTEYAGWARYLELRPHTFSAIFGAVVARGGGVLDVLRYLRPEVDPRHLREEIHSSGVIPALTAADLYPGADGVLAYLQARGLRVGIVGNQPREIAEQLRTLGLPADFIAVSEEWQLSKPDPAFFARVAVEAGCAPEGVLYVGDQLDNDVRAGLDAGVQVARVRTGPWGMLTHDDELEARCRVVMTALTELPSHM